MNSQRRKVLQNIYDQISDLKENLEMVRDEEDEARENMPESLHDTERYEQSDSASDSMYSAVSSLEEALDYIEEAIE